MAHNDQDFIDGWQVFSDWIDEIRDESDLIADYDCDEEYKQSLLSCSTNVDRFKMVWTNESLVMEINKFYRRDAEQAQDQRLSRSKKSNQESKRLRDLGNKSFKEGNFAQACSYYTEAIRCAPFPSSTKSDDSLSLALANRSAALFSLTRYRQCIGDIDLALAYDYPEANKFKLLTRKVKCLHVLSVWSNDCEDIKAQLMQTLNNPDTKEFIKTEIANAFEFIDNTEPEVIAKEESDIEDDTHVKILNSSKSLPQAADCVEMGYDSDQGRFLMINNNVGFGRLLVVESPFVWNLAPCRRNHYCYNCFTKLYLRGLSCQNCTQVLYCSKACLEDNLMVHSKECNGFLDFQEILGVAYLVSHIMFKIDFKLDNIQISTKKSISEKSLDQVISIPSSEWTHLSYKGDYASVLSLLDHASDYDYDSMMGYVLAAVYLAIAFQDRFPDKFPKDLQSQLVVGSVILRHLLQLQTNLISVLDQNIRNLALIGHSLGGIDEKPIGVAIYPTVSLINHSCSPNMFSLFHRNRFIGRASRRLGCGTTLSYCYGPSVNRMSKKDRQTRLQEQYFFTCECDSCIDNIENECRALVCPKCDGPVIYNRDLTHQCRKCNVEEVIDVITSLRKVDQMKTEVEGIEKCPTKTAAHIEKLKSIEEQLSGVAYWKNPLFVKIKALLIECAKAINDGKQALKYSKEELELTEKTYGDGSIESVLTKLKVIDLEWQLISLRFEEPISDDTSKASILRELNELRAFVQSTRSRLRELLHLTHVTEAESSFEQELKYLSKTYAALSQYISELDDNKAEEPKESLTEAN